MTIEKVNGFWVPANDVHLEDWKSNKITFTQSKCLEKFVTFCSKRKKKFNCILDIGAWVGTWTMTMNNFSEKIIAFEPDPLHYKCLNKNVSEDVETWQLAVGSENKTVSLSDDDFTQKKRVIGEGDIPMITVDSLGLKSVDVIKIDVEGYEMEVLKGAEKTLQNTKYLMIELNNNTKKYGSNNLEIENYIKKIGFRQTISHWPDKVFERPDKVLVKKS